MWFSIANWTRRQTLQEARSFAELVAGSEELRRVWESAVDFRATEQAVLDAITAREGISRPFRNFVAVLIDHQRIPFLSAIVEQFEKELNSRLGFIEAEITSARELDATGTNCA